MLIKMITAVMLSSLFVSLNVHSATDSTVVLDSQEKSLLNSEYSLNNQDFVETSKDDFDIELGENVYAYLTLEGKPEEQPKQLTAQWYHCDKLIASYSLVSKPTTNPHHVWFWVNSSDMGAGVSYVNISSENGLLSQTVFKVKSATGEIPACSLSNPAIQN